jgi:YVTN family beta-propeller protein
MQKRSMLFCSYLLGAWLLLTTCATGQKVIATIPTTGSSPSALAINTVTNKIYVLNQSSGTVDVLDRATNSIVATVPVSSSISRLAINESTNKIYVVDPFAGSLSVIDGTSNTVTGSVRNMAFALPAPVSSIFARESHRTEQGICILPRIQSRMLNDDWNVRLYDARIVGGAGNWRRVVEIVEADVLGAPCREIHYIRPHRLPICEEDCDFDVSDTI